MKTTETLWDTAGQWWQQVAEGWQHLRDRAARAITRFTERGDGAGTAPVSRRVSWGLLPVDIRETDDDIIVELEMPGLDKSDIAVEVHGEQLLVRGEKRYENTGTRGRYHIHECAYGSFQRVVPLPQAVDGDAAAARYTRGVLRVKLPKQERARRRQIEIR